MAQPANHGPKHVRRVLLIAAAVAVGTLGWVLMGETDSLRAAEPSKSAAAAATGGGKVLARIGNESITEEQVAARAAAELRQLERQRHEILSGAVRAELNDRLVEREAKERGVKVEDLLAIEVEAKVTDVTEADVDKFYMERRAQIKQPKEQIAEQIRGYLRQQQQQQLFQAFVTSLEKKYDASITFEPLRVQIAGDGPAKGPANAPVTIVEFSDFECPFCSRVNPTLAEVLAKYGDKVRLVFRQYPLGFHPKAQKASEAALCAHDQGHFWALHDLMFSDQKKLAVEDLKASAATIQGLDAAAFAACLDGGKHAEAVQADVREGNAIGVSGTPSFFINGRFVSGALPLEAFSEIIDEELARVGGKQG